MGFFVKEKCYFLYTLSDIFQRMTLNIVNEQIASWHISHVCPSLLLCIRGVHMFASRRQTMVVLGDSHHIGVSDIKYWVTTEMFCCIYSAVNYVVVKSMKLISLALKPDIKYPITHPNRLSTTRTLGRKPCPHQQQYRSNRQQSCQLLR